MSAALRVYEIRVPGCASSEEAIALQDPIARIPSTRARVGSRGASTWTADRVAERAAAAVGVELYRIEHGPA
ncbi:hypothetical protein ACIBFB_02975 [Nocardiopsis sp. NPDC050513]|uniref:hypothetical protein n=1 Tax=Nocardiopsis sp. NPDC050513 TaxID=3364338 RepID=UPI00378D0E49